MIGLFKDIVDDYQKNITKGITEVYYKSDLVEGVKLLFTFVGLGKIALTLGGLAASAIGSILSFTVNNPKVAARCAQMLYDKKDEFIELFKSMGDSMDKYYKSLPNQKKKYIKTVVLLIAKNGLDWDKLA